MVVDKLDFNDSALVSRFRSVLVQLVRTGASFDLDFKPLYYFTTPRGPLPSEAGWYVIYEVENRKPVYVGKADNLDYRLNSDDGSRDNFGNPHRPSDPERNFIKKLREQGAIGRLAVKIIKENDLCRQLGITPPLSSLDRTNIEKMTNLHRSYLPL